MPTPYRTSPAAQAGHHHQEERHILDYVRVVYKRRWLAIPVFAAVVVMGVLLG